METVDVEKDEKMSLLRESLLETLSRPVVTPTEARVALESLCELLRLEEFVG